MACKRKNPLKQNINRAKWHVLKRFDRKRAYYETINRSWKIHLASGLHVPEIIYRKVVYDAIFDVLKNRNGNYSSRWREFLNEYDKFNEHYRQYIQQHSHLIQDWENYRRSNEYRNIIEHLKEIKYTDKRIQANVNHALGYLYAKFYKDTNLYENYMRVEKALKLDVIPKVWSKKSLWLLANLLVFDPMQLYASTEGQNIIYINAPDEFAELHAVKIHVTRWYERKDYLDDKVKFFSKVYENVISVIAGEIGSVVATEILRRGIIKSLLHTAYFIANVLPHSRLPLTLANVANILNNSVLAWLGFQIFVEWNIDEQIQKLMHMAYKYLWYGITGDAEIIKKPPEKWKVQEIFDLWYTALTTGKIDYDYFSWLFNQMPQNVKDALFNMMVKIQHARKVFNLKKSFYELNNQLKGISDLMNTVFYKWHLSDFLKELKKGANVDDLLKTYSKRLIPHDMSALFSAEKFYQNMYNFYHSPEFLSTFGFKSINDIDPEYKVSYSNPDYRESFNVYFCNQIVSLSFKGPINQTIDRYCEYIPDEPYNARRWTNYDLSFENSSIPFQSVHGFIKYFGFSDMCEGGADALVSYWFHMQFAVANSGIMHKSVYSYDRNGNFLRNVFDDNEFFFCLLLALNLSHISGYYVPVNDKSSFANHYNLLDFIVRLKCISFRKAFQPKPFYLYISKLADFFKYRHGYFHSKIVLNLKHVLVYNGFSSIDRVEGGHEESYFYFDQSGDYLEIWKYYNVSYDYLSVGFFVRHCNRFVVNISKDIYISDVKPPKPKSKRSKVICIPSP